MRFLELAWVLVVLSYIFILIVSIKIIHPSSKMCGQIYILEVNWTLMLLCLAITVGFKDISSHMDTYALKAVANLPAPFCSTFSFRYFNSLQSECFPTCYFSDVNMVISAPTGSGKTVLFELCIMRLLSKFIDGVGKFSHHKGTLKTKFDGVTRSRIKGGGLSFFSDISLMLIHEVHLLNDPLGAALEAITSRIKMLDRNLDMKSSSLSHVCFLAVSATILNINDLDLLMQFSGGKSALIFCSTRKGAQEAAQQLSQIAMTYGNSSPFIKIREQEEMLREASLSCSDKKMQSYILYGVGYHNGGLSSAAIPHLMSINCILGLVPIPNLYPLVDQLKHEHAAKVTGHSESWFYTDGVILESDSKDDFYSVGEEVSHGSLSNLGCPRFSNQPLLENGTDYQPASDVPQNEAKNPPLLRGENSRGNEPGGVHNYGFISNRLLPCLACDGCVEAKRRAQVLGGSSMRRRMVLTPSFKWREAQENSVLSMAKPIVPRPIAGSEVMCSPFEKKQPECWSRVDPNTL